MKSNYRPVSLPASCNVDDLVALVQHKLTQAIATGPCRGTLRILSSRMLEVLEAKSLYEKSTVETAVGADKRAKNGAEAAMEQIEVQMGQWSFWA